MQVLKFNSLQDTALCASTAQHMYVQLDYPSIPGWHEYSSNCVEACMNNASIKHAPQSPCSCRLAVQPQLEPPSLLRPHYPPHHTTRHQGAQVPQSIMSSQLHMPAWVPHQTNSGTLGSCRCPRDSGHDSQAACCTHLPLGSCTTSYVQKEGADFYNTIRSLQQHRMPCCCYYCLNLP
jgi:hypothetical protein